MGAAETFGTSHTQRFCSTAAAAAAQPAECASLWRGAGRARARACRPASPGVRACACAPQTAPSWFCLLSRLRPLSGDQGWLGFHRLGKMQGGGGAEAGGTVGGGIGSTYVSYWMNQSKEVKGRQRWE